MKSTITVSLLQSLLIFTFAEAHVSAGDWPQWRGPSRDGKADFKVPTTWPKELTKKWQVTVGDGVSTPALAGGKLYVFTRENGKEVARCLDAATGKELWQDKEAYEVAAVSGPASGYTGPRSSPVVAAGNVITYGVRGTLSCFDASSGKLLWRKDSTPEAWPMFFTSSSPLIENGVCIAQIGGQKDGAIVALDLATGGEKWKWTGDGSAYASPILGTIAGMKVIVAQSDKRLVVVNFSEGKLLWETSFAGSGMGGMNSATPILDGQTLIFSGTARGTKAVKLAKQGDALSATELWSNRDNSIQYNSPVLNNELIFGLSARDALFCINEKDGTTAWTSPITGKRGFGSIVNAGSVLFLLTPAGNLVAFEPSGKEFKQLASYKVADGDTTAYPVLAGNQVFVKDKESLSLWVIE
ncbi:MAG: PQQ-binding-like beta-propeller repeat protein [Limisphaerales bacterium]